MSFTHNTLGFKIVSKNLLGKMYIYTWGCINVQNCYTNPCHQKTWPYVSEPISNLEIWACRFRHGYKVFSFGLDLPISFLKTNKQKTQIYNLSLYVDFQNKTCHVFRFMGCWHSIFQIVPCDCTPKLKCVYSTVPQKCGGYIHKIPTLMWDSRIYTLQLLCAITWNNL